MVGDGVEKKSRSFAIKNAEFKLDLHPSAEYMIQLAEEKFVNQQFEDVAYFEPFYLKEFMAGKSQIKVETFTKK